MASASRFDPYPTHQSFSVFSKMDITLGYGPRSGSSILSGPAMGNWRNWERSRFAFYSQQFESAILHQKFYASEALLAMHWICNPGIVCSIQTGGTKFDAG